MHTFAHRPATSDRRKIGIRHTPDRRSRARHATAQFVMGGTLFFGLFSETDAEAKEKNACVKAASDTSERIAIFGRAFPEAFCRLLREQSDELAQDLGTMELAGQPSAWANARVQKRLYTLINAVKLNLEQQKNPPPATEIPLRDGWFRNPAIRDMVKKASVTASRSGGDKTLSFPVYFGDKGNWQRGDYRTENYSLNYTCEHAAANGACAMEVLDERRRPLCKRFALSIAAPEEARAKTKSLALSPKDSGGRYEGYKMTNYFKGVEEGGHCAKGHRRAASGGYISEPVYTLEEALGLEEYSGSSKCPKPAGAIPYVTVAVNKSDFNRLHGKVLTSAYLNEKYKDKIPARFKGVIPIMVADVGGGVAHGQFDVARSKSAVWRKVAAGTYIAHPSDVIDGNHNGRPSGGNRVYELDAASLRELAHDGAGATEMAKNGI